MWRQFSQIVGLERLLFNSSCCDNECSASEFFFGKFWPWLFLVSSLTSLLFCFSFHLNQNKTKRNIVPARKNAILLLNVQMLTKCFGNISTNYNHIIYANFNHCDKLSSQSSGAGVTHNLPVFCLSFKDMSSICLLKFKNQSYSCIT